MTMKELMKKSQEELDVLKKQMTIRGNMSAGYAIDLVIRFGNKKVKVVKGRKVPIGTEGVVFWMGSYCNSPYRDPWGIYTTYRCGIRDEAGDIHWTAVDNIELA